MNIIVGQNESLPNIKGEAIDGSGKKGLIWWGKVNGVFKKSLDITYSEANGYSTENTQGHPLVFDASSSSSVYKNEAKVTTKNFTYKHWTRIS